MADHSARIKQPLRGMSETGQGMGQNGPEMAEGMEQEGSETKQGMEQGMEQDR